MWKPTKKLQTQQRPPSPPTNNAPLPPNEGKLPKSDESRVVPLVFVGGEGGGTGRASEQLKNFVFFATQNFCSARVSIFHQKASRACSKIHQIDNTDHYFI